MVEEIKNDSASLRKSEQDSAGSINRMGNNLNELKVKKLFKEIKMQNGEGYTKWMIFIKEEFEFTPQYANRLMVDAKVQQKLEEQKLSVVKQPDAILYMIRNVEDLTALWVKVTNGDQTMIPSRSQVQEAMEKPNRGEKVSKRMSIQKILNAIKPYLVDENEKNKLRDALRSLLENEEEVENE